MLRSPRDKFISSTHLDSFKKLIQAECFEEATTTAMLELERDFPLECTPQQSADAHQQMVGARKYLDFLVSLATPQKDYKTMPRTELNYSAGV